MANNLKYAVALKNAQQDAITTYAGTTATAEHLLRYTTC